MRPHTLGNTSRWSNPRSLVILYVAAAAGFTLALAYIAWRTLIEPREEIDFRAFWVAGRLWLAGISPYAPGFEMRGRQMLPGGNTVNIWFYPPNWWLVCVALGGLSHDAATLIWRLSGVAALFGGTVRLVLSLARDQRPHVAWALCGCAIAAVVATEATGEALAFGQSAPFLYLGICLVVAGILDGERIAVTCGLILLALKPQLALPFYLWALLTADLRITAVIAAATSAVLSIPQLLVFGIGATLHDMLANIGRYGAYPVNNARNMTGPVRLLDLVGINVAPTLQLACGMLILLGTVVLLTRRRFNLASSFALLTALITALFPLHSYDMALLMISVFLIIAEAGSIPPAVLVAVTLAIRPSSVERWLGVSDVIMLGHAVLTVASLLILLQAIRGMSQHPGTSASIS